MKRKAEAPDQQGPAGERDPRGHRLLAAARLRAARGGCAGPAAGAAAPALSDEDLVQRFMDEFDAEELPPEPEEQT